MPLHSDLHIVSNGGCFQFTLESCNPDCPASFWKESEGVSEEVKSGTIVDYVGGRYPAEITYAMVCSNSEPTEWNQNPVKLSIGRITCDQGEFTGNSAVLYGYFLAPYGQKPGFYINAAQSQKDFQFGSVGISCGLKPGSESFRITLNDL